MKGIFNAALMCGLLSLAACKDYEQYDSEDYCLDPRYKVPLEVLVDVDYSFRQHHTVDSVFKVPVKGEGNTRADALDVDSAYLKYFVVAYPTNPDLPVVTATSSDRIVPMSIHPGRYTMVGWASYEQDIINDTRVTSRALNFYTDDFDELLLRNKYNYQGAHENKLAYRGVDDKNISYNMTSTTVKAKPAMGMYQIVATDSAEFVPDKVIIRYSSMLPASIHGRTGEFNWWWSDISFSMTPNSFVTHEDGDVLAADYVLSQESETSVTVTVEVYDPDGNLCARKENVEIPLINGGITTVKGNFYSVLEMDNSVTSGSGISIKTEWDATFEIEI